MARPRKNDRSALKSERLSIALKPADFNAVATLAAISGVSINDFVGGLLLRCIELNADLIADFDKACADFERRLTLTCEEVADNAEN